MLLARLFSFLLALSLSSVLREMPQERANRIKPLGNCHVLWVLW